MIKISTCLKRLNIWLELQTVVLEYKINNKIKNMTFRKNWESLTSNNKYSKETLDILYSKIIKNEDKK